LPFSIFDAITRGKMNDKTIKEFYGTLGRVVMTSTHALLRVYPFGFLTDVTEPVFEISVDQPCFTETDLRCLLDGEIEVLVYTDYVQIDEVLEGQVSLTLRGNKTSAAYRPYDLRDYAERVAVLDRYSAERFVELTKARRKLDRLKSVSEELVRRAGIKAHVSHDHSLRQAGAIEALRRVLAELELDE
jgi:hypothetical protein